MVPRPPPQGRRRGPIDPPGHEKEPLPDQFCTEWNTMFARYANWRRERQEKLKATANPSVSRNDTTLVAATGRLVDTTPGKEEATAQEPSVAAAVHPSLTPTTVLPANIDVDESLEEDGPSTKHNEDDESTPKPNRDDDDDDDDDSPKKSAASPMGRANGRIRSLIHRIIASRSTVSFGSSRDRGKEQGHEETDEDTREAASLAGRDDHPSTLSTTEGTMDTTKTDEQNLDHEKATTIVKETIRSCHQAPKNLFNQTGPLDDSVDCADHNPNTSVDTDQRASEERSTTGHREDDSQNKTDDKDSTQATKAPITTLDDTCLDHLPPPDVALWVCEQRLKRGLLNDYQRKLFDTVDDEPRERNQIKYAWFLAKLRVFRERFGHVNVPIRWKEDPRLGKWVSRQRDTARGDQRSPHRRYTGLAKEKQDALEALGFVWYLAPSHNRAIKQGHQAQQLVSNKRKWSKPTKFVKQMQKKKNEWYQNYAKAKAYFVLHGHCCIPPGHLQDDSLVTWLQVQSEAYQKFLLDKTQMVALEQIGFERTVLDPAMIQTIVQEHAATLRHEDCQWKHSPRNLSPPKPSPPTPTPHQQPVPQQQQKPVAAAHDVTNNTIIQQGADVSSTKSISGDRKRPRCERESVEGVQQGSRSDFDDMASPKKKVTLNRRRLPQALFAQGPSRSATTKTPGPLQVSAMGLDPYIRKQLTLFGGCVSDVSESTSTPSGDRENGTSHRRTHEGRDDIARAAFMMQHSEASIERLRKQAAVYAAIRCSELPRTTEIVDLAAVDDDSTLDDGATQMRTVPANHFQRLQQENQRLRSAVMQLANEAKLSAQAREAALHAKAMQAFDQDAFAGNLTSPETLAVQMRAKVAAAEARFAQTLRQAQLEP